MNNAKHTPGPWGVRQEATERGCPLEVIATKCVVAKVYDHHEGAANAHLIAAAPAMYEALEHAAMSCHHPACKCKGEYASQPERYCTCHVQKARQALAQAEGRQACASE